MKELKEYLTPSLCVLTFDETVNTLLSEEADKTEDPYGNGSGGNWWENP